MIPNDESTGRVKLILNLVSYYISSDNLINFIENLNLLIAILNLAFLVIVFFTARCLPLIGYYRCGWRLPL